MTECSDPPPRHRAAALCLAAVVGVAADISLWQLRTALANLRLNGVFDLPPPGFFLLCIFVGSFVAILLCLMVGLPLWHLAERHGRRSRADALRFGLLTGAIIGGIMAGQKIFGDASPWPIRREGLFEFAEYCVAGVCAGLVARRAAFAHDHA